MTESDLLKHISEGTTATPKLCQPTYYDSGIPAHPTEPVDYDEERLQAAEQVLGKADFTYHPALGCPHIDIHRYPKTPERPFCSYLTSGMSDFPIYLKDGSSVRIELLACTADPDPEPDFNSHNSLMQVIRYVSLFPFIQQTGIHYYHVVELPTHLAEHWPNRIFLIPPFLLKDLANLPLMGQRVTVLSMIQINAQEFSSLCAEGPRFLDSLPDGLETWLFNTVRKGATARTQQPPLPSKGGFFSRLLKGRA